jgi:hypothetical protein
MLNGCGNNADTELKNLLEAIKNTKLPEGLTWENISSMLHGCGNNADTKLKNLLEAIKNTKLPEGLTWKNISSMLSGCGNNADTQLTNLLEAIKNTKLPEGLTWKNISSMLNGCGNNADTELKNLLEAIKNTTLPAGLKWQNISSILNGCGNNADTQLTNLLEAIENNALPNGLKWKNISSMLSGCGKNAVIHIQHLFNNIISDQKSVDEILEKFKEYIGNAKVNQNLIEGVDDQDINVINEKNQMEIWEDYFLHENDSFQNQQKSFSEELPLNQVSQNSFKLDQSRDFYVLTAPVTKTEAGIGVINELRRSLAQGGNAEIFFPIKRGENHWNLGQIRIDAQKQDIVIYSHDPYGGGYLEDYLRKAFTKNEFPHYKVEIKQSPMAPMQGTVNGDDLYCGGYVNRMLQQLIQNPDPKTFDVKRITHQGQQQNTNDQMRQDDVEFIQTNLPDKSDQFCQMQQQPIQKISSQQNNLPQSKSQEARETQDAVQEFYVYKFINALSGLLTKRSISVSQMQEESIQNSKTSMEIIQEIEKKIASVHSVKELNKLLEQESYSKQVPNPFSEIFHLYYNQTSQTYGLHPDIGCIDQFLNKIRTELKKLYKEIENKNQSSDDQNQSSEINNLLKKRKLEQLEQLNQSETTEESKIKKCQKTDENSSIYRESKGDEPTTFFNPTRYNNLSTGNKEKGNQL